ncbi:hypothetical protein PHYPSEUDO_010948 [Phytophthora pseudosyringae]|uniref:Uncharacterized protein n=1 Tax=Phytophthora pseudosyringae TaxID=221518 RepID=A0A8T1VC06_9STRA|nr:hypothetical protein PHYPSEUDO_010945 [Phytophthora pseudosyringae]KAG7377810.1 hypothetical protein PHYPSEUDO_010948 [Phytophthora pseudosyringae]
MPGEATTCEMAPGLQNGETGSGASPILCAPGGVGTSSTVCVVRGAEQTENQSGVPDLPLDCLKVAATAMHRKCLDEYGDKRQCKRRTNADPYRLANFQKRIWVDRYMAARNSGSKVDYVALSTKTHFKNAFEGNSEKLKKHEGNLLKELYTAYEEDCAQREAAQHAT